MTYTYLGGTIHKLARGRYAVMLHGTSWLGEYSTLRDARDALAREYRYWARLGRRVTA